MKDNKGKLLIIGVGNMGEALVKGILKVGLFQREEIFGLELSKKRASYIEEELGIKVFLDPSIPFKDKRLKIVLLCVKHK